MSDLPNDSKSVAAASASTAPTRPYFWSVWREIWENRSIFIAPMIVAVVVLLGFLIAPMECRNGGGLCCCSIR